MEFSKNSNFGYDSEFAIFDPLVFDASVKSSHKLTVYPVNDFTSQSYLNFNISNQGSSYIDLSQCVLNVSCRITYKNGDTVVTPDLKNAEQAGAGIVAPINNFLSSIFSKSEVSLQNNSYTCVNDCYAYTSYFKSLLYTDKSTQDTSMGGQMFYKDTAGKINDNNWLLTGNDGLVTRAKFFADSNEVQMSGRIFNDIMEINRYLPNGINLNISFTPSTPEFCLLSPDLNNNEFKIVVTKASLDLRMITPAPAIIVAHSQVLEKKPAYFAFMKSSVRKFTLGRGLHSAELPDVFQSQIPSEFILGIVSNNALYGSLKENPFNFANCSLSSLRVSASGFDQGFNEFEMKYLEAPEKSSYISAYNTLFGLGSNSPEQCPIERLEFPQGYSLYRVCYDGESAGNLHEEMVPVRRTGSVRISLAFDKPLPEAMTVVIFDRIPSGFKIDKNRCIYPL